MSSHCTTFRLFHPILSIKPFIQTRNYAPVCSYGFCIRRCTNYHYPRHKYSLQVNWRAIAASKPLLRLRGRGEDEAVVSSPTAASAQPEQARSDQHTGESYDDDPPERAGPGKRPHQHPLRLLCRQLEESLHLMNANAV